MDKKPLRVIRRSDILVWDKTTKGCEELLSTPRKVNVCKGKIWPDLHLGSEDPIPQFLQSFPWAEIVYPGSGTIFLLGGRRLQVAI